MAMKVIACKKRYYPDRNQFDISSTVLDNYYDKYIRKDNSKFIIGLRPNANEGFSKYWYNLYYAVISKNGWYKYSLSYLGSIHSNQKTIKGFGLSKDKVASKETKLYVIDNKAIKALLNSNDEQNIKMATTMLQSIIIDYF